MTRTAAQAAVMSVVLGQVRFLRTRLDPRLPALWRQPSPLRTSRRVVAAWTPRILQFEGPTLFNPHFATGAKDGFGSRIVYEPLAQWD